ncbi:MAG TPA: hypothetical protein VF244_02350 [Acidimicrobiales bacterium]
MNEQLLLLRPDERPWRLDEHTRAVGRQGVQEARAALRQASPTPAPTALARRRRLADGRVARPTAA